MNGAFCVLMDNIDGLKLRLRDLKYRNFSWLFGQMIEEHLMSPETYCRTSAIFGSEYSLAIDFWERTTQEFRELVQNPDEYQNKIPKKLATAKHLVREGDCFDRLTDIFAEVESIVHLSTLQYSMFSVRQSASIPHPDFWAQRAGKRVCIEVKNLREPFSLDKAIRAAWNERRVNDPDLVSLNLEVISPPEGSLSPDAFREATELVNQLPPEPGPYDRVLQSGAKIRFNITSFGDTRTRRGFPQDFEDKSSYSDLLKVANKIATREIQRQLYGEIGKEADEKLFAFYWQVPDGDLPNFKNFSAALQRDLRIEFESQYPDLMIYVFNSHVHPHL